MTPDQMRAFLKQQNVKYEEKQLQHGIQFRCDDGEVFVVYNTGRLVPQGAVTELTARIKTFAQSGAVGGAASAPQGVPTSLTATKPS